MQRTHAGALTPAQEALDRNIEDSRNEAIDAAVVRTMKHRKELPQAVLTSEVIRQLAARFPANPRTVKQRIELLMEKEFLARADTDRALLRYLA